MKKFSEFSIHGQIASIIAIVVIILISAEVVILYFSGELLVRNTQKNFEQNAKVIEDNIDRILKTVEITNPESLKDITLSPYNNPEANSSDNINSYIYTEVEKILNIYSEESNSISLLLEGDKILLSNSYLDEEDSSSIIDFINSLDENPSKKDHYIKLDNRKYLFMYSAFSSPNWGIVTLVPKIEIQRNALYLIPVSIIVTLIGITILAIACRKTILAITLPVEDIVAKLNKYTSTDEYEDIETPLKNEISEIADHINIMMHKIKESNEELLQTQKNLYELEYAKVQAELSYYQSQINPHFLYNTLESIRSISTLYEATEIEELSLSMSKIFRYAVKEGTFATLREEIECIKEYLRIMDIRFPGKYKFSIEIDDSLYDLLIPKMTLQPIVENCFKHGFSGALDSNALGSNDISKLALKKKTPKMILIRSVLREGFDYIEVIDTGKGVPKDLVDEINFKFSHSSHLSSKGLGLNNINKRLALCFSPEYRLTISSIEGCYTKLSFPLPNS